MLVFIYLREKNLNLCMSCFFLMAMASTMTSLHMTLKPHLFPSNAITFISVRWHSPLYILWRLYFTTHFLARISSHIIDLNDRKVYLVKGVKYKYFGFEKGSTIYEFEDNCGTFAKSTFNDSIS